ncbi:hypothetical protein LBMAG56_51170 [Verrucomicrobiota bacterium]|nr:hypothetical protein LBMAG56_51170 [Verrucomicrobiota bacterium]
MPTAYLDKLDARALCLRLSRWVDGNRDELSPIRIPSETEQHRREGTRRREFLTGEIRRLANRGHGQVAEYCHVKLMHRWWGPRNWKKLSDLDPWVLAVLAELQRMVRPRCVHISSSLDTNRCFDCGDVDFHLFHHGCHRLVRNFLVGTHRQLRQPLWENLPRHPVAVLEPSAVALLAAIRSQRRRKSVGLCLSVRCDRNRNRLGQSEHRPGIENLVWHPAQREVDD